VSVDGQSHVWGLVINCSDKIGGAAAGGLTVIAMAECGSGIEQTDEADSDEEIISGIRSGRTELYDVLLGRHFRRLCRVAASILKDDAEAEDVVQEACLRAYLHLGEFAGRAQFTTWLTRIVIYEAIARRRYRARWRSWDPAVDLELCAKLGGTQRWEDPERRIIDHELRRALASAIENLPQTYRVVFLLRLVYGQPAREVAARLAISENSVRVRLCRARARLRLALGSL
jgi:RNA polymerase sigma-70 factor (ECF subfamily)